MSTQRDNGNRAQNQENTKDFNAIWTQKGRVLKRIFRSQRVRTSAERDYFRSIKS
jgi:hypothetical protein